MARTTLLGTGLLLIIIVGAGIYFLLVDSDSRQEGIEGLKIDRSVERMDEMPRHSGEDHQALVRQPMEPTVQVSEADPTQESMPKETEGASHRIQVESRSGIRIEGAKVGLYRTGLGDPRQEAFTSPSGEVAFVDLQQGDKLRAEAEGFLPVRMALKEQPWPDPIRIVLEKAKSILNGYVLNDLERPVPEAVITMEYLGKSARAETGKDGYFSIAGEAPVERTFNAVFQVGHPDHCFLGQGLPTDVKIAQAPVYLRVHRWAKLWVKVFDEQGDPVNGVRIRLAGSPNAVGRYQIPGMAQGSTSLRLSRGPQEDKAPTQEKTFSKAPPVLPLWLVAERSGYHTAEKELGKLQPGEEREVNIVLRVSSGIREFVFQVVDEKDVPVPTAEVWLLSEDKSSGGSSQSRKQVDETGIFHVEPLQETWMLEITAPGFALLRSTFTTSALTSDVVKLVLTPDAEGSQIVIVRDHEGSPLSGIFIEASEEGNKTASSRRVKTDESGQAVISGLDRSAAYTVKFGFGKPGGYFWNHDRKEVPSPAAFTGIRPGGGTLVFRLAPPASISGTIYIDGLEGKPVFLSCMTSGPKPTFTVSTPLNPEGDFYFTGLPPGKYRLWMEKVKGCDMFRKPMAAWDLGEGEKLQGVQVYEPR